MFTASMAIVEFGRLTQKQKTAVLCLLALNLTVSARAALLEAGSGALGKAKAYNEMQHKILGVLQSMIAENNERYPDDVLLDILFGMADEAGISEGLAIAWTYSIRHAK